MKTKFKIALSMGHTPDFPGATRAGVSEYGLSCKVIGDLAGRLDELGHKAWIIGADSNRGQVEDINQVKPDFGLELHFNNMATRPKWNGSLVMHSGSYGGIKLAQAIQTHTGNLLGVKNRGIYKGHYQLDKRRPLIEIIRKTNCPFVVPEPLYFSNDSDFKKINITLISVGILRGCLSYWKGLQ